MRLTRRLSLFAFAALAVTTACAQKRAITAADFDSWKAINGQVLSRDGHWLAYGVFPQEGDGFVVIRNLSSGQEFREPAGELPPPPAPDESADGPPAPRAVHISFTHDCTHLAFLTFPTDEAVKKAKKDKAFKAQEELVIFDLATGKSTRIPDVKSVEVPEKGDGYLAYQKYAPASAEKSEAPATGSGLDAEEDQARGGRAGAGGRGSNSQFGSTVVLLTIATGSEKTFSDVLEYELTKDAKLMAYSVASPKPETDGVFTIATTAAEPKELIAAKARFQHLTWDDKENALAFIGNPGETIGTGPDAKKPLYNLYLWRSSEPKAQEIVTSTTPGLDAGFIVNDHAALAFSKDGTRVFFGAAPPPPPPHAAAIDEDKPSFDLWNWKDDAIPPAQKVRATADLNRSYRAEYLVEKKKTIQLADQSMTDLVLSENGRYGLGADDRAYRPMSDYSGERIADSYLVDTDTGARTLLRKKNESAIRWSGDGRYAVFFDGKDWNTIAVPSGKTTNLTARLPVKFWNEEYDSPSTPPAYGLAGWTKDDKYVLVYDHYDVWQLAPDGSSAVNLTQGIGRAQKVELRYVTPDREEKTIDPARPLLLHAEDSMTHDTGFYTVRIGEKAAPTRLMMAAKDFSNPTKAKDADVYLLTAQTYTQFPDLFVTDSNFTNLKKVSDANPQAAQLMFGTDELVSFENVDGVKLQGILYKPDHFDASKKYPMIVYLYEKLSQNVNHFVDPKPMDSINISYYVSNGYLVFTPDIVYQTGYPGQSALKCVMAGVNAVTAKGFVDEKNIGIQGHSWGGYQIAYMVTQTNRFKAAEDGAPVADMISAYDGIRWGPGRPRQFQYEATQSRIGGTPWQYPLRFIENSPIFMVDKVQTPLLIIANDADDAVPWYQGIEFFLALRRLNKEAYMFTYNGEPHHLRRRPNQKDYAARMAAFFNYELKGAPEPAWMIKGIPYLHTDAQVKTDK